MSSQVVAGAGGDDDDARALRELLVTDDAYDPTLALTLLVRSGCILEAFLVAERCHCIPTAFTTMVQNGMLRLPSDAAGMTLFSLCTFERIRLFNTILIPMTYFDCTFWFCN